MKIIIWVLIISAMSLYGYFLFPALAQDNRFYMHHPENWEEIAGKLESIDLDTSVLAIKAYSDKEKTSYQEITILVTKMARIEKDGQVIALKELKAGDEISIRYVVTINGQKEAYYLWVK